jgi:hypothetical protein
MQRFLDLFISINYSTCFRRFLRPPSGAQKCIYSVRYCQTNTAACCYRGWDGTPWSSISCCYRGWDVTPWSSITCCYRGWDVTAWSSISCCYRGWDVTPWSSISCCYRGWDVTPWSSISSTIAADSSIGLTIPDAVCAGLCSWWWAKELPETCRAIYRNK